MCGVKSRNSLIAKFFKLSFLHSYYRNHGTHIKNTNNFLCFYMCQHFYYFLRSFIDRFPINVILIFSVQCLVSAKHFFVQSWKCVRLCVNDFIDKKVNKDFEYIKVDSPKQFMNLLLNVILTNLAFLYFR
jgi:hypothetical protein